MPRSVCVVLLSLLPYLLFAQGPEPPADFLRSINKLYVVVAVIALVFLGIAYYLWSLDRRMTELEDQIDNHA